MPIHHIKCDRWFRQLADPSHRIPVPHIGVWTLSVIFINVGWEQRKTVLKGSIFKGLQRFRRNRQKWVANPFEHVPRTQDELAEGGHGLSRLPV